MNDKNQNLLLRVLSAAALLPLALWVTFHGGLAFALLCSVAAAITAGELIWMFERRLGPAEIYGLVVSGLVPIAAFLAQRGRLDWPWMALGGAGAAIGLLTIALFRPGPLEAAPRWVSTLALSWLYCGLLVAIMDGLRERFGPGWVLLAYAATWGNDTLAYFAGRALGRHQLYPRISPKKTWEGFAGGVLGSVLGALVVRFYFLPHLSAETCVILGLGASLLGPAGDLCESMLKRAAGVKDSGKLLPGHGGLLDRIDALLFVVPWVYALALIQGR